ncbi:MAG: aminotransferase class I/II-fold pyridoxal phosphate-dependent enzyme, partial [Deltaproteobacteria bacterium]|nr:aminotransferase class I/II-fold pyridoxal phosphate-dependent enzyme [Deltaproteobacteria bacterium]
SRKQAYSRCIIVTESVFSMDGDRCDIDALTQIANDFDAITMVDEAHATGVWGPGGMGLTDGKPVDIVMGTFGKACGSFGAYIACSRKMREYMINCGAGLIYSTGLPPQVLGAIDAALDLIPQMDAARNEIRQNAGWLRDALGADGWSTGNSSTQIIPIMVGDVSKTLSLSRWLEACGILGTAIRPPTVPAGSSRIRVSVTALHSRSHVRKLRDALKNWEDRDAT